MNKNEEEFEFLFGNDPGGFESTKANFALLLKMILAGIIVTAILFGVFHYTYMHMVV